MLKKFLNKVLRPRHDNKSLEGILKKTVIGSFSNFTLNSPYHLEVGANVEFRAYFNLLIYKNANLKIGDNVFFNNYCSINCLGYIEIGENTIFGEGVKLYDHNHKYNYNEINKLKVDRNDFKVGKIVIGKNCWIGSNVTILNNVEIGDNVIIGANNLIYKSVLSNTIVKLKPDQIFQTK